QISCNGVSDGTITVTATGGTGTLSYSIDGGSYQASNVFSGLAAGVHTLSVKDANNCVVSLSSVTITQPAVLSASHTAGIILCNGGSATVVVSATGGILPYSGTGSFSATVGAYSYTVTDANGCTASTSGSLSEPAAITLSVSSTNVACFGFANGTITASASAGATITVNGQPYNESATYGPGTYTVTATTPNADNSGVCSVSQSVTITQPALMTVSATRTNVTCNGAANGTITVTCNNPTATITINSQPYVVGTQFAPGTYTILAVAPDGNNDGFCSAVTFATITQPTAVSLSSTQVNVICNGASTGSVDLSVTGGTPPYSYTWSNGATTQDVSGLAAGTYTVTVNDANGTTFGCTATRTITITQPTAVALSSTQTNILCNGASTGAIDLSVSGGTAPYTYSWSNGATTQDLSGLAAGTYSVVVNDANGSTLGCTASTSVTITQPSAVSVSTTQTNPVCNGAATGSIDLSVSGGTAPYTYSWSNGATTQDLSD
ncbi:MAG: SprB repeat-containing protein, partial [Bacteroidota bacterium]